MTKPLCVSSSNLADMLTMVNPIDFGGQRSKVKVIMGIIDKYGVRGDATLCVVIFIKMIGYFLLYYSPLIGREGISSSVPRSEFTPNNSRQSIRGYSQGNCVLW